MCRPVFRLFLGLLLAIGVGEARADPSSAVATVRTLPSVISASTDNAGNLWVMVQNHQGADWNTYAMLLCKVVRPHQARIFLVKIIDVTSVHPKTKPAQWQMLGAANCALLPPDPPPVQQ